MQMNVKKTSNKDIELLDRLFKVWEKNILPRSIELSNKPIESLDDYGDTIKWFIRMIAFIKNYQRSMEKKIKEELETESKTLDLDRIRAEYIGLESLKVIFQKSADLKTKIFSLYRYEPELLDDQEFMDNLRQEYLEHMNNYAEFMDRTLKD
jgi:hypothetical protein